VTAPSSEESNANLMPTTFSQPAVLASVGIANAKGPVKLLVESRASRGGLPNDGLAPKGVIRATAF
jgi:hypothetical protein